MQVINIGGIFWKGGRGGVIRNVFGDVYRVLNESQYDPIVMNEFDEEFRGSLGCRISRFTCTYLFRDINLEKPFSVYRVAIRQVNITFRGYYYRRGNPGETGQPLHCSPPLCQILFIRVNRWNTCGDHRLPEITPWKFIAKPRSYIIWAGIFKIRTWLWRLRNGHLLIFFLIFTRRIIISHQIQH